MTRTLLFTGLIVATLPACSAVRRPMVDARAAAQVEIASNDPPPGCAFLGPIKGSAVVGDLGDAHGDAVRNAVMGGGNFVAIDMVERPVVAGVGGYMVHGRLFSCPRPQAPEAPRAPVQIASVGQQNMPRGSDVAALPKAICEPDCSPGFTCLHGACVTACNPGCASNEQCGGDRTCHAKN